MGRERYRKRYRDREIQGVYKVWNTEKMFHLFKILFLD